MKVETCHRCDKPVSVEVETGFHCCLQCKLRLIGYSYWSRKGRPTKLQLFKNTADAEAAASKGGEDYEVSAIWTDVLE